MRFFDCQGRFGAALNRHCGFPAAADLVRHLDHLGIERAVAFNAEGREGGCSYVNRKTLAEIAALPGGRARLIPAFSVSPVMMYADGGLEELRRMVAENAPALHFTKGLSGYHLSECDAILSMTPDREPAVFLNFEDADRDDLLATAERHPDVTFVLTDIIWGRMAHTLDLMSRRGNICVETSWLHVTDDLEILHERFGAERILFGAGERANYGAAIAALAAAEIPQAAKEKIARGNLERLLGLDPSGAIALGRSSLTDSPLWQNALAGKPLDEPVIDAHVHLGASGGYVLKRNDLDSQLPHAVALAGRVGVKTMIVSGLNALIGEPVSGNAELEEKLSPHGELFKGYVGFNPKYADALAGRLDDYFSRPFFVGFKTLCDYWRVPITDPRFKPMLDYADKHRLPILNHTWNGTFDSPAMFTDIVREYPDSQFILGHSGGGNAGRAEAEKLANENANVWLEWCGTFCSTIPWEDSFTRVGPEKMIFGSDAFCHNLTWELGRMLSMDIPEERIRPMLGDHMRAILAKRR